MQLTFQDRTALVTGAGRGIGKAIAETLAAAGVNVICVSKSEQSCGAVAEGIRSGGGRASARAVDVADGAAVAEAAAELLSEHERIDILVNNAGITRDGLMLRMSDADWHDVIKTNLSSCFFWIKGVSRPMTRKRWGRIVNISSVVGLMGNPGQINYSASKAGILGLTKSLAKELASRSVTCNAVAPGFIETDMTASLDEEVSREIASRIPLKRLGTAKEVANLTAYLCSEEAGYVTGQVFTVDGGLVM